MIAFQEKLTRPIFFLMAILVIVPILFCTCNKEYHPLEKNDQIQFLYPDEHASVSGGFAPRNHQGNVPVLSLDTWKKTITPKGVLYDFNPVGEHFAETYRLLQIRVVKNNKPSLHFPKPKTDVNKTNPGRKGNSNRKDIHTLALLSSKSSLGIELLFPKGTQGSPKALFSIRNIVPDSDKAEESVYIDFKYRAEWFGKIGPFQLLFHKNTAEKWDIVDVSLIPYKADNDKAFRYLNLNKDFRLARSVSIPSTLIYYHDAVAHEKLYLSFGYSKKRKKKFPLSLNFSVTIDEVNGGEKTAKSQIITFDDSNHWIENEIDLSKWHGKKIKITCSIEFNEKPWEPHSILALWTQPYVLKPASPPKKEIPNIIMLSLDTLRPDYLGCYGNPESISPYLDRFSKQSQIYTETFSHSPSTGASHASLLTSLYPSQHGLTEINNQLHDSVRTLSEELKERGYVTAAVTGGVKMAATTGLCKGFNSYSTKISDGTSLMKCFIPLLEKFRTLPLFLFYHTYHIHAPYQYNTVFTPYFGGNEQQKNLGRKVLMNPRTKDISEDEKNQLTALYKTGIREMDFYLYDLFASLKKQIPQKNTTVIILSDHGEQFGKHNDLFGHCNSLYDELIRVPLIICKNIMEKDGSGISTEQTGLKEIMPALLRMIDSPKIDETHPENKLPIYSEMNFTNFDSPFPERKISIRDGKSKLIYDRDSKAGDFFNVLSDPQEIIPNGKDINQEEIQRLNKLLDEFIINYKNNDENTAEEVLLDEETRNQLQALGYLPE